MKRKMYKFWTDGGDEDSIIANSLTEAAEIAAGKITAEQWNDGAYGWVKDVEHGCQQAVIRVADGREKKFSSGGKAGNVNWRRK